MRTRDFQSQAATRVGAESGWLGGWLRRQWNLERILYSSEADLGATGWEVFKEGSWLGWRGGQDRGLGALGGDSSIQNLVWLSEGEILSMETID